MKLLPFVAALAAAGLATAPAAERINHEGRLLGPLPTVTQPLLFNTPEADAVLSAMQVMPVTSAWHENISQRPLLPNSAAMISQIATDLGASRSTLRIFQEMNFVLVPDSQPTVPIRFFNYPTESDLDGGTSPNGRYPIPSNLPVETWPTGTGSLTLSQWQRDVNNTGGDRHSIIVKPGAGFIWETWLTRLVNGAWQASNGAKFDLKTNTLRPAGWTSADAAGLPMFPALVRYDECERGVVEHALRIVVKRSRLGPIYPATHAASVGNLTDPNIPAMGQRVRLKSSFVIPATWTKQEKAILHALKKYGALVADNGGFFSISITPDSRWPAGAFDHLSSVAISNFEVVQTTGATEGPRSAGAPVVSIAPVPSTIPFGTSVSLAGSATGTGVVQWKVAAGPGAVTFGNAASLSTTASFRQPGSYVLTLSVDDGLHAVAYAAVRLDVMLPTSISRAGADALIQFQSLTGRQYRVDWASSLTPTSAWNPLGSSVNGTGATLQIRDPNALTLTPQRFYRVSVLP